MSIEGQVAGQIALALRQQLRHAGICIDRAKSGGRMTTYSRTNAALPNANEWNLQTQWVDPVATASGIRITNADGTVTELAGTGLDSALLTGDVDTIRLLAGDGTLLATIAGFAGFTEIPDWSLATVRARMIDHSLVSDALETRLLVELRGGSAADVLYGYWNNPSGAAGNPQNAFYGLAGGDTLVGSGGPTLNEAHYEDDALAGGSAGVYVDLQSGFAQDGFGSYDTLIGINSAYGTFGLRGGGLSDIMIGHDGANFFELFGGRDYVVANGGNDTVVNATSSTNDIDTAGDTILGGAGDDFVVTAGGQNFVYCGDGSDLVESGDGDDWLFGGQFSGTVSGADSLAGGGGNDVLAIGSAGGSGGLLYGDYGNDTLYGGSGVAGDETIYGAEGSDFMWGGAGGNDTYVFGHTIPYRPQQNDFRSSLIAGDFDWIIGFDAGDKLVFLTLQQPEISVSAITLTDHLGNVAAGALVSSTNGWGLWLPYADPVIVAQSIEFQEIISIPLALY
ncbi:MAG: calcium-binding protein [Hyphomicrobiaceae bacterium]